MLSGNATAKLAEDIAGRYRQAAVDRVAKVSRQCLLDWIGCALAGRNEDAVRILIKTLAIADRGEVPVIGTKQRFALGASTLLNGTMGHALDYDDVHPVMGHPSVPVIPAALVLAHHLGANGAKLQQAIITGIEVECHIGRLIGPSHYEMGWHSTATIGTFGAAAAACQLLELDVGRIQMALGIAASQAAGLKSMFGTMTKPLQAGHAAQAGLQAGLLAANGFTANACALEAPQGFAATQSRNADLQIAALEPDESYLDGILFKYHAACFLTHSAIQAMREIATRHGVTGADVNHIIIDVDPMHMSVCNIEKPATGLELKFSLRGTVGLALLGENTSDIALYSDDQAARDDLKQLMARMEVRPVGKRTLSTVEVHTRSGQKYACTADSEVAEPNLAKQQERLEAKFRSLAGPVIGKSQADQVVAACASLSEIEDTRVFWKALAPS